ncbi:MAG: PAS domain S-box protein [Candidatus Eremiobacteraeota bacterium]|nr:PAS domain S-box protein [Candidatus Eremiobacteraeota bacterium]
MDEERPEKAAALEARGIKAEDLIMTNIDFMQKVIDGIPNPFYFKNRNGVYEGCNREFEAFTGKPRQDLIGRTASDIFPPPLSEKFMEMDRILMEDQATQNYEISFQDKEGTTRYAIVNNAPFINYDGSLSGLLGFIIDITGRKHAEEALRNSEKQYRDTINSMGDSVSVIDRDLRIVLFNRIFREKSMEVLKIDPQQFIGRPLTELFPFITDRQMADYRKVFDTAQTLVTEDTTFIMENEYISEIRRIPLMEGDKVIMVATVVRDITERKLAEDALRESEMKYRGLAHSIPDIIVSIDKQGKIIAVNEISSDLTGYGEKEIVGTPFLRYIHEDDRERVLDSFLEGMRIKRDYNRGMQFRIVKKDGSIMWIELNSHSRYLRNGDFLQEDGVMRDITERKRATEELKRLNEELDHRVAERTKALSEEILERNKVEEELRHERSLLSERVAGRTSELSAANAELSRAVRAKDEFLASMSHELRTPLSAILSISESLDEGVYGDLVESQKKALKNISESGQHLLSLINDILDLSKIEAGKITLDLKSTDVEAVCQASMRLAKAQAYKKQLTLSLTVDSNVSFINADERYLKQMLVNLLSNAVKFTPEGGKIGMEVQGDGEHQVARFAVWDTGIGIPPDKIALLFKPFTQLDSSLSRQYGGTGLGLALVARLAELHRGSVSLESAPDKGSRFTINLPWEPTETEAPGETGHETDSFPVAAPLKQALVVEDSLGDAEQVSRYLGELGISTVVHPKGEDVLQKAMEIKPDIVILDLMLPGIDGWAVLSMLKADEQTASIPVIITSVIDEKAEGVKKGALDYIVKPISRGELRRVLGAALKKPEAGSKVLMVVPPSPPSESLILLAEDNETIIGMVTDYLQAKGYRVVVARNGGEAVTAAREWHPEVILMDVQMPGVDGLEATRRIRNEAAIRDIPVIALTALAMPGDRERCLEAGADYYLSKPVSLKKLKAVIEAHRGKSHGDLSLQE